MGFSVKGAIGGHIIGGAIGGLVSPLGAGIGGAAGAYFGGTGKNPFKQDSGRGTNDRALKDILGFNDQDLIDFENSNEGAQFSMNHLKNGFARFDNVTGEMLGYSGDQSKTVAESFITWKKARDESAAQHAAYVDLTKKSPGRQATIIVPSTAKESGGILG